MCKEVERAESLYPEFPSDIVKAVAIMLEEAGEVLQIANEMEWNQKGRSVTNEKDREDLKNELIQTGAMVFRCLLRLEL
jgi:hypothetical protein